jgi:hydrogenase maturation protein HypF
VLKDNKLSMGVIVDKKITVSGAVQGVGFRPFIYNTAQQLGVVGEVYNNSAGVVIIIQCSQVQFNFFLSTLKNNIPTLASITDIAIEDCQINTYLDFNITHSRNGKNTTVVLPDACICAECINDIIDKNNRRYGYAFTNCTNCGPRFSIIKKIPYDRKSTSMACFTMCQKCQQEYQNPNDRRFHAQPNACSECGPQLQLTDSEGEDIVTNDTIKKTADLLKQGKIIAIKGVGGFHLACLASSKSAVAELRKRKHRAHKPFALMAKDVEMVQKYCQVSQQEEQLLTSNAAPIVLLIIKNNTPSSLVAPKQKKLGFMLPYTPLHYLLLQQFDEPLVLTSGNKSHNPQITDNQVALQELTNITDYFLMHNRDIVNRLDDSVVQYVANETTIIRRARGYAPSTLPLPHGFEGHQGLLAVGAELKNTFCLITNNNAIISQHIGDLKTLESYQDFQDNIALYQQLYESKIKHLVCDLHPEYLSSKYADNYAENNNIKLSIVQHHHAHIAACLFENGRAISDDKVLGVAWDGLGLGADNNLWGGEFLLADYSSFKRLAYFEYIPLLGGDKAQTEPWRMAYAYLKHYKIPADGYFSGKPTTDFDALLASNMALNYTSSVGRLFDAVAYLLDICTDKISYEAQAAIELENMADACIITGEQPAYEFGLKKIKNHFYIDSKKFWISIIKDLENKVKNEDIAYRFHLSLAKLLVDIVLQLQQIYQFNTVVLSGGVFHNQLLLTLVNKLFTKIKGITLLTHSKLPFGDGSVSLGQAAISIAREEKYG